MFELVYFSVARPNLTQKEILDILVYSRKWNYEHDVTGLLIYNKVEFLQLIEGDETTIRELFEKIKKDVRHQNLILLAADSKKERVFPNWNMAYQNVEIDEGKSDSFNNSIKAFSDLVEKPTLAVDLFWTMAKHLAR
ncbi:MAG: hypothetical protein ACJAV5_002085 [Vicingaceae bacterium]|jgi:hypothetical protein